MDPPEVEPPEFESAQIEFIYFDLGHVLVSFDPAIACRNLADMLSLEIEPVRHAVYESGLQDRFEHGEISGEEFVAGIRERLGLRAEQMPFGQTLDAASDMFTPIDSMAEVLELVRDGGLRVGLLSNTCHAHWDWICRQPYFVNEFSFDATVLSYEVGAMKPAAAIYAVAEEASGIAANRLLFLDDKPENVEAARARGWHAALCLGGEPAIEALKQYRVLGS